MTNFLSNKEEIRITKKELVFWSIIILIAILCWIGMQWVKQRGDIVVVSVEDCIVQTLPLSYDETIRVEGDNGNWVELQITDGKADVTQASCPDQICVNHYAISEEGEPIVCLPAKVVIQVKKAQ
ncbi:MAG: NusG domain II-containing protein [Clostridiales bacterium]|nr:NusG domain II-containing protein [Clostridiales bacterium]